jgi:hypothetical protein
MKVYDWPEGWTEYGEVQPEFTGVIEWSVGSPDLSGIEIMLTQGLGHPVYAKVTVWTFGTGTPFYVADPASLLHLLPQFIEGQKFLHSNKWSPPI